MISPLEARLIELMHVSDMQTSNPNWLDGAMEGVDFLRDNHSNGEDMVVFASSNNFLVYSVLASSCKVSTLDHEDLEGLDLMPHSSWSQCIGPDRQTGKDRLSVSAPFENCRYKSLIGGEKLIYERSIKKLHGGKSYVEISQKFLHLLDLHFDKDRNAYCCIDNRGNIEEVVRIYLNDHSESWKGNRAVTIKRKYLDKYLALTNTSMISRFDTPRYEEGSLWHPWGKAKSITHSSNDIYYEHRYIQSTLSVVTGYVVHRSNLTKENLLSEWKAKQNDEPKKYASFKIHDRKNGKYIETSCSPNDIVNYFDESDLPWEISPAFFDPEVLVRYQNDPDKYLIDSGGIECIGGWYLKSCERNSAHQVYAFIGDLATLPYKEQLYWEAFNEWPKAGVTVTTIERDYRGQFPSEEDSLESLKSIVRELDRVSPAWWNHRGERLINDIHLPATESVKGWGSQFLALDKALVEGFREKALRSIVRELDRSFELKEIRSIKLLEAIVLSHEGDADKAKAIVRPLYEVHLLRSKVNSHSDEKGASEAVSRAIREHGDVRDHFKVLVADVKDTMSYLVDMLGTYMTE